MGDLGNIAVDEERTSFIRIVDRVVKLTGENSVLNRAIVIHEGVDDLGLGRHKAGWIT